jgi:uncharacterized repeat protein (TIGR01451 family)
MSIAMKPGSFVVSIALLTALFGVTDVQADSVAQVQTAKRIARSTVVLIDPQGRPGEVAGMSDTAVRVGDILTFVIQFTPVPNGSTRGLGGYVTDYIPRNTEVVGARIIDADGNTAPPHRGGLCADGVGPRGAGSSPLPQGSLTQLYADTGIYYSTDPLTERWTGAPFITLFDGIEMNPEPTGVGQLDGILGAGDTTYAHNSWDWVQALAFGVGGGVAGEGKGNTPHLYGSPVAGPDTWYSKHATYVGPAGGTADLSNVVLQDDVGPWRRIQTPGAETGTMGAVPDMNGDMPDPGVSMRVGIPAVDGNGQPLGFVLSPDNPLPSYDAANPDAPYTRAVRFALGELVVGEEYFAEISLRVKALPLDPVANMDLNCAEVFGGDASAQKADGSKGGKDNAWRYFLPAPSCVVLNNFFELSVDKIAALDGERLTYTVEGKNLSTVAQTNVVVRQCFPAGIQFVSATGGGTLDNSGAGCPGGEDSVVWTVGTLQPGDDYNTITEFDINGGVTVMSRAIYTSDALPDPGFQVVAMTNVRAISVLDFDGDVTPGSVTNLPTLVDYSLHIHNRGTGAAEAGDGRLIVTLPSGFVMVPSTATIDQVAIPDPGIVGSAHEFQAGLVDVPAGGQITLTFQADVPANHPQGAYTVSLETWMTGAAGKPINDAETGLAELLVGIERSEPPVVSEPLLAGTSTVSGTTTEAAGTEISVQVNGVDRGQDVSDAAGEWTVRVPSLFAGQRVTARALAAGELISHESSPAVIVAGGAGETACSDGVDNDNDGLTDFPDDPGCTDANDVDETDVPECSDGIDNDGDGLIDFPDDPKCSSFRDETETGSPECSDGIDNDGDGQIDTADDDCADADGAREAGLPECSDGIDNDGDGDIDYPFDRGCDSAEDDHEADLASGDMGGVDVGANAGDAGPGSDTAGPVDPGGLPARSVAGRADEGCCATVAVRPDLPWPWALMLALLAWGAGRRRDPPQRRAE